MIRNPSRLALLAALLTGAASAATLPVGPGKTYTTPCAAIAAAKDGDTIEIAGGTTYNGDVCKIVRNGLTIRGIGVRPKIDSAGKISGDKAIWVVDGNDITVDNVEMFGAASPLSGNAAALRLEARNFTLSNSFLHDNENGILSNSVPDSDIVIENTEFGHNGRGDGQTHNLYIGKSKSLTFRFNFSHDANVGHNLKSRAYVNMIAYNRFSSTVTGETSSTAVGQPSFEIDLPNAGTAYVIGNVIHQPAANQNAAMVAFGAEGPTNPTQDLYVVNNTFLNDYQADGPFVFVSSKVTTPALIQNNIFSGAGKISSNPLSILKSNFAAPTAGFLNRTAYDLHPVANPLVVDAATDPGVSPAGVALAPSSQYVHPAGGEPRPAVGALDIGAYEATPATLSKAAVDAPAAAWIDCAGEGGYCKVPGTRQVRYGAGDKVVTKVGTGVTACFDYEFGNPAPGQLKSCAYSTALATAPATTPKPATTTPAVNIVEIADPGAGTWTKLGGEGATVTVADNTVVRFGINGKYMYAKASGKFTASSGTFGRDPAPGFVKVVEGFTPTPAPADTRAEALGAALSALLGRAVTVTIK